MREWIPVPGSAKARLVLTALEQFGAHGYEAVNVTELAASAGVTTGALYHHFGSKLGLYQVVREEAERRVLDRMEGAAAARAGDPPPAITRTALLVGFDYVADQGLARLLAEQRPQPADDPIEAFLGGLVDQGRIPIGRLLAAAWRAALAAAADAVPPDRVRAALSAITVLGAHPHPELPGASRPGPSARPTAGPGPRAPGAWPRRPPCR